jgi:hypothetical protein
MEIDVTAEYLKALDEMHNPSSVEDGFSKYPDSKYQARLDKLYFSKTKEKPDKPQKQMCVFDFEIISGEFASRRILKFAFMDTADGLDFLTRDLRRVGIDSFMWSNVQEKFAGSLDKLFELELKTGKGGYQAVYIQKQLNSDSVMVSSALKKEDVPF